MYRLTPKAKAMMSAKLLMDIESAAIIDSGLVRGATDATRTFTSWAVRAGSNEAISSGVICLRRLHHIERHALSIESHHMPKVVLQGLHEATRELKAVVQKRQTELLGDANSLDEEDIVSSSVPSINTGAERMPTDVRKSSEQASFHHALLCVLLVVIMVAGVVGVLLAVRNEHLKEVDELERETILTLTLVVRESLDVLYEAMVNASANLKLLGPSTAAGMLFDMSSRTAAAQDVLKRSDNYLVEYRGAVQDFDNSNQVTQVLTERAYGGICQTNITLEIDPINDVRHNQSYVIPQMTPNMCRNDATRGGLFSNVMPSYLRYADYATTYRRNLARLVTFFHNDFGLSIAITMDRETFQEYLTPEVTLVGPLHKFPTAQEKWANRLTMWGGLSLGVGITLIVAVTIAMMASNFKGWAIAFSVMVGLIVSATQVAVLLATQSIFNLSQQDAILLSSTTIVESVVGAVLAANMVKYQASEIFLLRLCNTILKGSLFTTDSKGTNVQPEFMQSLADIVDSPAITAFYRGQYTDIDQGYAISATYLDSMNVNIIRVVKLTTKFRAHWSLAIVFGCGVVASLTTFAYVRWSRLSRLRSYAVGSCVLRYHVSGSRQLLVYYIVLIVCGLAGMIGVNAFSLALVEQEMTQLASASMILMGAFIRVKELLNICYNNCGMPDYIVPLFYVQAKKDGDDYPTIEMVDYDFPYPYPTVSNWVSLYPGSQLSLMNIFTSLVNIPSFSTPIANLTNNVTDPRRITRSMMTTTGLNTSAAFSTERFAESFYPSIYYFVAQSVGVFVMVVLLAIAVTVTEWQYIRLHVLHKNKQNAFVPYAIMASMLLLVFSGFIIHPLVMKPLLHHEFSIFNMRELEFLSAAIGYRVETIMLKEIKKTQTEILQEVVSIVGDASVSAELLGTKVGRIRIAVEYPERGGGTVQIQGVSYKDPVKIGDLEKAYVPVCGTLEGEILSDYLSDKMRYCFVEMSQHVNIPLSAPRIYLMAVTEYDSWVNWTVDGIWPTFFGMSALVGVLVLCLSSLTLFFTLHTARRSDFPLFKETELNSFAEPLPPKFTMEYFLPRRHRVLWVISLLLLGLIVVYFTVTVGNFMSTIEQSYTMNVPYQTQGQVITDLVYSAMNGAYNYLIFPDSAVTLDTMMELTTQAIAGQTAYHFVTDEGITLLHKATMTMYTNLTNTQGVLNEVLMVAAQGFGSYTAVIAGRYSANYFSLQETVLSALGTITTTLVNQAQLGTVTHFAETIVTLKAVNTVSDLIRKMYVLDAMTINSYADVAQNPVNTEIWPFDESIVTVIKKVQEAASNLRTLISTAFTDLTTALSAADPTSNYGLVSYLNNAKERFPTSYALHSTVGEVWGFQHERLVEIMVSRNKSVPTVAKSQLAAELACIDEEMSTMTKMMGVEMSRRKTVEYVGYFYRGEPIEGEQVQAGWQRLTNLREVQFMWWVSLVCTMASFCVVGICIVLHFKILRTKLLLSQVSVQPRSSVLTSMQRLDSQDLKKTSLTPPSESSSPMLQGSKAKNSDSEAPLLKKTHLNKSSFSDGPAGGKVEEDAMTPSFGEDEIHAPEKTTEVLPASVPRRRRWVMLPLACFVLVTIVPMASSFFLVWKASNFVSGELSRLAGGLLLYTKVLEVVEGLDTVLRQSVLYYLGLTTISDYNYFLDTITSDLVQLRGAYFWYFKLVSSAMMPPLLESYNTLTSILNDEASAFARQVQPSDVPNYYTTQSKYSRGVLLTLADTNNYGTLIPVAATTSGSAVGDLADSAYTTADSQAQAATTAADFKPIIEEYSGLLAVFDNVAEAELQIWRATIAGGRSKGSSYAPTYCTFGTLVGSAALAALDSSTQANAPAAKTEITNYFQKVTSATQTTENVATLFAETFSPPAASTPPVSTDAFFAAAYVSSTLTGLVTIGKFANIFAYNRNLVSESASLSGKTTLIEAIGNTTQSMLNVLSAVADPAVGVVIPAKVNPWVWHTQVDFQLTSSQDHTDFHFLKDAVRWCCITSFWSILVCMFVGVYTSFIK